jgi:hypothetical protein
MNNVRNPVAKTIPDVQETGVSALVLHRIV